MVALTVSHHMHNVHYLLLHITPYCITIMFDHTPEPYPVERVKGKLY